jgi:hypothetical protein
MPALTDTKTDDRSQSQAAPSTAKAPGATPGLKSGTEQAGASQESPFEGMSQSEIDSYAFGRLASGAEPREVRNEIKTGAKVEPDDAGEPASNRAPTPPKDGKPEPKRPAVAEPEKREALIKATNALRRAKVPTKVIEALPPDELIAMGEQQARVQADLDRAYTDLDKVRKGTDPKAGKPPKGKPAQEPEDEGDPAADPDDVALNADDEALVADLEEVDPDLAKRTRERLSAKSPDLKNGKPDRAAVAELEAELQGVRKSLIPKFPDLADERAYDRVLVRATRLSKTTA